MQTPPCPLALARALELTAPGFIITVYGDVVVPRGEVLWMGSLLDICARVGFGENQVRTAVSRLVASGRLSGERQGRRSFYRLADAARAEFGRATALLYAAAPPPQGWLLLALDEVPDDLRRAHHLAPVGGACWLAPDRGALPPGARVVMRVRDDRDVPGIAAFWDLDAVAARYDRMIAWLGPVAAGDPAPGDALTLRLLLVHAYRAAVLRDPFLPPALLPGDWSGAQARALFRDLYLRLTPDAEAGIAQLQDATGPLPTRTPDSMGRIALLR